MENGTIVSVSPAMCLAMQTIRQFAKESLSVLLVGATGTGKELLARELHRLSGRPGRLVDVNCAALPRDLAEGELFGHRKGAFTHAYADADGLVHTADRGSLFLDEVTSLPLEQQAKLLRVVEQKEVLRVGETKARLVDFRLIAAALPDIYEAVAEGRFREDLLHRVCGVRVQISALSDRREDILPLARHFAQLRGAELDPEAGLVLLDQAWPGNVRELRAAIERASVLCGAMVISGSIMETAILSGVGIPVPQLDRHGTPHVAVEREWLFEVCRKHRWNGNRIAGALGISRATLFRKLKSAGLSLRC